MLRVATLARVELIRIVEPERPELGRGTEHWVYVPGGVAPHALVDLWPGVDHAQASVIRAIVEQSHAPLNAEAKPAIEQQVADLELRVEALDLPLRDACFRRREIAIEKRDAQARQPCLVDQEPRAHGKPG